MTPRTERQARILVVEDQDDLRQMLTMALEIDGHLVDAASNARDGLKRLHEARYNLVLSDYAMPGATGAWMLQEAARLGLLNGVPAIIVTAHPNVRDLEGIQVITKPLDLDHFLAQVRTVLDATRQAADRGMDEVETGGQHRVELVLYISSSSPASIQACRNLERLLERFDASQVKCSVRDLVKEPLAGEYDRIAFTPTLVKRYPEPRMWVLGNLRDAGILSDMLRVCGVDGRE
jgi:DNA-binding NtrC family response regulator